MHFGSRRSSSWLRYPSSRLAGPNSSSPATTPEEFLRYIAEREAELKQLEKQLADKLHLHGSRQEGQGSDVDGERDGIDAALRASRGRVSRARKQPAQGDAGAEGPAHRLPPKGLGHAHVTSERITMEEERAEALPEPSLIAESSSDDDDVSSGGSDALFESHVAATAATRLPAMEQAQARVTFLAGHQDATRAAEDGEESLPGLRIAYRGQMGDGLQREEAGSAVAVTVPTTDASISEQGPGQRGDVDDISVEPSCGLALNTDFDGDAVVWGMSHRKTSATECCAACKAHARCNIWVWCPLPECWSADIWNHTLHECWLKVQPDPAHPKINMQGKYPPAFKAEHKTAPDMVPWVGGVILDKST
eukprot:jgi/Mesvir1/16883/Mv15765-RA.1